MLLSGCCLQAGAEKTQPQGALVKRLLDLKA